MIEKIEKREGRITSFKKERIEEAILECLFATDEDGKEKARALTQKTLSLLERDFGEQEIPTVEDVQDRVEKVLMREGLFEAARAYILYRDQRRRVREMETREKETVNKADQYIKELDWEVKENANMGYSLQGLNTYLTSHFIKQYWLEKVYPPGIRQAERKGDFHIHDLQSLSAYCTGWDLYDLLKQGFGGVRGKIQSAPAKHLGSALGQLVNFLYSVQGEVAGAIAVSNWDTLLAPFIRYDHLSYPQVKQEVQEYLFNMNVPTRTGFQSLAWGETVVVKKEGKIKVFEVGDLIDKEFEEKEHRVLEKNPGSYALRNFEDYQVLSFNEEGEAVWTDVKAFVRHKVPEDSEFIRLRTSRGSARVSPAHSLFRFQDLDEEFDAVPVAAEELEGRGDYHQIDLKDHLVALKRVENDGRKEKLDLLELLREIPQLHPNVLVKINPAQTVKEVRENVLEKMGSLTAFYKKKGIKDQGVWQEWLEDRAMRYDVWNQFYNPGPDENPEFRLRKSSIWYPRFLEGEDLENLVKLCAWYLSEGHTGISTPLYISQGKEKETTEEIYGVLEALNARGWTEELEGCSEKGRKASKVSKITGKGLLCEIVARSCGFISSRKEIPWFVFNFSLAHQELFIKTMLKGDGSEYKRHRELSTTSKKLASALSLLLAQHGRRFSVYPEEARRENWSDRYILRLFKKTEGEHQHKAGDFEARACLNKERFRYERRYEYDISVDLPQENFVGGTGLLVFHNTPFTNHTLDISPSPVFKDQPVIIGGQPQEEKYGDFQPEMDMLNRAFYEVIMEGDFQDRVFTFPIPTINVTPDFPWDKKALEPMWEATAKYGINYFGNYMNSDMKPEDVRSMCPLHGDEKVLLKSTRGRGLEYVTIRGAAESKSRKEYEVYSRGQFVKGEFNKFPDQKMMRVGLENGHEIRMSEKHLNFATRGPETEMEEIKGKDLEPGMYLPYSLKAHSGKGGNRDLGYFVGAYAGDGSFDKERSVVFSFEKKRKKRVLRKLKKVARDYFGGRCSESPDPETDLYTLRVHSRAAVGLCKDFVKGKKREKHYRARVFDMSKEFRQGVIEGHCDTDGGNGDRIYTSSPKMVETLNMLAATLGTATSIHEDGREEEPNFAVLIYQLNGENYGDFWFKKENKLWVGIKEIEKTGKRTTAYCFEVAGGEPVFTVGTTGVLTHNCRLRLEKNKLYNRGGGGLFGSGSLTGSIGVVTANLPRIGYLAENKKEFFGRLGKVMDLAKESLEIKRKTVEHFTEKGLYPYCRHWLQSIKKMRDEYWGNHFSTIGLIGMNEALLNFMDRDLGSRRGRRFAKKVLEFMRERLVKYQEETGNLYNLEATPGEGTAFRLPLKDKKEYPDIITAGTEKTPYYTNSTQLPVDYTDDLFRALKLQDDLQRQYTGGCIEKGNKVLTDKGLLPIEEIVRDFENLSPLKALSYNPEERKSEWDEVTDAVEVDVSRSDKIRVEGERNLDIVTSDWHPFFVLEKVKPNPHCPVCEKRVGNVKRFATHLRWSPSCRRKYENGAKYEVVEKRADELEVGDYILQNSSNLYPEKKSEISDDLMWLIGFFIGGGRISESTDERGGDDLEPYKIRFSSEHEQALEKVVRILGDRFGSKASVLDNELRSERLKEVSTSERKVWEFFLRLGFEALEKPDTVSVPEAVKREVTKSNVWSLLGGLTDSDGTIDERGGDIEYYTVSGGLAADLAEVLSRAGILFSERKKELQRENEYDIWRIRIPASETTRLKDRLDVEVDRQYIKDELSGAERRRPPVVRVKRVGKEEVEDNRFYDLTTKDNHNYLAGKNCLVFVHNTVQHLYLGERINDPRQAKRLVRKVFEKFNLPYISLTPTFSVCPTHGYLSGEHFTCPKCTIEQPCEVYSRVVGYLRPVGQWNEGKQQEFKERKEYKE